MPKSSFRGVSWSKKGGKWKVRLTANYKIAYGGTHAEEEDAARAYDALARKLKGSRNGYYYCP